MENKKKISRILSIYSIVNIIYLLILLLISVFYRINSELLFPQFLALIPISLIFYLLAKLPICHIVFYVIYTFFCIGMSIKEKCRMKILFTIFLSVFGILLNVYWLINGKLFLVN